MNANRYIAAKKELYKKLGDAYPTSREGLTFAFLTEFGSYVPGVDENDYEDYGEYEAAKYSSERWSYYCKLSDAIVALQQNGEAGKAAWEEYIDWVMDNYFPEYTFFNSERPGIIHAHTEDLPFFDKSKEVAVYNVKMEKFLDIIMVADMISVMMFSEGPADYTIDASWFLGSYLRLLSLSRELNKYTDDEGRGWKVRNGELRYIR